MHIPGKPKKVNYFICTNMIFLHAIPDTILYCYFCNFQESLGENSNTLVDLFKPLDGKNIEDIEEESSSVFSDSSLKVIQNNPQYLSPTE